MTQIQIQQRPFLTRPEQFQGVPPFMAEILARRGVQSEQELELKLKHIMPPHLKGLDAAVELIDQAIDRQQQIVIIGDYDADGATSTALMILVLKEMGAKVEYLVPDRFKYGYGLTPKIAELAKQSYQPDVLITVDNGISSHAGVEIAQALGMQVIITDHHLTTKPTPNAEAVVNPNQLGCDFPSKALAGVGVAFYVLANLSTYRKKLHKSSAVMSQYLDLVALGTYADVASLDYNNRILVDVGLKRIQQHLCRPGISALLEIAGREAATLKAQDLGFVLGPRINAAGRMETMDIGIECLLAQDFASAYPLAEQLNQLNVERRQVDDVPVVNVAALVTDDREELFVGEVIDERRMHHDEGVFIAHVHHQGGNVRLAQDAEGVQAPFSTDQHVFGLAVFARALGNGDGLFEADELDALDDLLKDFHVAFARVEDFNAGDRDQGDGFGGVGQHERLLSVCGWGGRAVMAGFLSGWVVMNRIRCVVAGVRVRTCRRRNSGRQSGSIQSQRYFWQSPVIPDWAGQAVAAGSNRAPRRSRSPDERPP